MEQQVFTVSQLIDATRAELKNIWPFPVKVSGEFSNVKQYPSGHIYLTLKDKDCEIRAVIFRGNAQYLRVQPQDGQAVIVEAEPTIYRARGSFQLIIKSFEEEGKGKLYAAFIQLKEELAEKGWFDQEHKQPLPLLPRLVGIVASDKGDALRDVNKTLQKRFPGIATKLFVAPAQGDGAETKIAAAIDDASKDAAVDVIIVCRGGGSFEDFAAYNTFIVAEAIYNCQHPVIAGVGHEPDISITDLVADHRAATPTAAAQAAVPDQQELLGQLNAFEHSLRTAVERECNQAQMRLDLCHNNLRQAFDKLAMQTQHSLSQIEARLKHALALLANSGQRITSLQTRLEHAVHVMTTQQQARLAPLASKLRSAVTALLVTQRSRSENLAARLTALSPQRTLARGFALVTDSNEVPLTSSKQLSPSSAATLIMHDGASTIEVGEETDRPKFLDD